LNEKNNHIDNLIAKTISGNASFTEIKKLEDWKNKLAANEQLIQKSRKVWINTSSTFTYDVNRFNKKIREVNLEVEAYFEVTSDKKKTFRVNTPLASINVTSTAFNVTAYPGDNNFETVLAEGSVNLQFIGCRKKHCHGSRTTDNLLNF
jgi:hypothetical protein